MSDTVIHTEGLGKRYRIGAAHSRPRNFREAIARTATAPFRNLARLRHADGRGSGSQTELVWALRDLSIQVRHGEVLGVIGRNGSGKSTLLKLLSRITNPTTGYAEIRGRVGSLLEVGTGFHPELTGRDNVYLNGSILGLDRASITRRFDEIVAFAEVERFIDTPVKRYSSGMYLRLAFAVAAHLEPEILLVDEVLAVGDAAFQRKCLGRMGRAAEEGRTVLFVSHNMTAVQGLCSRAIWLGEGELKDEGPPGAVVSRYLQDAAATLTAATLAGPPLGTGERSGAPAGGPRCCGWSRAGGAYHHSHSRPAGVRILEPAGGCAAQPDATSRQRGWCARLVGRSGRGTAVGGPSPASRSVPRHLPHPRRPSERRAPPCGAPGRGPRHRARTPGARRTGLRSARLAGPSESLVRQVERGGAAAAGLDDRTHGGSGCSPIGDLMRPWPGA